MGAAQHPAIFTAREPHIRPKRKFCRSRARKGFLISISSFNSYKATWDIGIIARGNGFVNRG